MSSRSTGSASRRVTLAALVVLLAPAPAQAKKRVVLFDFSGPAAESFQGDVENVLRRRHSVVTQASYVKRARKLRADKPTATNVSRVARDMSVDGLIIGTVKRIGPRYQLDLKVRAGADGSFGETIRVRTRKPGLSGDALTDVKAQLLAAIVDLPPVAGGEEEVTRGRGRGKKPGKGRTARRVQAEEEEPVAEEEEPVAEEGDDDDDQAGGGDDAGGTGGDAAEAAPAPEASLSAEQRADLQARGRGLDIAAGASFMGRRLTFTVRDGLGDQSPRGYDGTPVAGAFVVGELYPLAFNLNNRGVTRNFGITGMVDKVLKIESRLRYTDDAMAEQVAALPTEQMRWGLGVVYRHNFGSRPTSPTLKASIRYNRAKFIIDKGAAPVVGGSPVTVDIPNMDYAYVDPGVALRFPLGAKLAVSGDVRYLIISNTGEMQQMDQYGSATVTGVDADLGLEYKLGAQLSIRAGGRLIRIGYDFEGGAELTDNRDGDTASQDVFGAQDRYLGGYATAAYVF